MKGFVIDRAIVDSVCRYGADVLSYESVKEQKKYLQHGVTNVYDHAFAVAYVGLALAARLHLNVDERSLVRGALLHDYFLYDWHVPDKAHRLHGFTHAKRALKNALKDFKLNAIEKDVIRRHMFPLNPVPPRYLESWLVGAADKVCTCSEVLASGIGAYAFE